jgi:uncharacterized protein (TIGR03435 family)
MRSAVPPEDGGQRRTAEHPIDDADDAGRAAARLATLLQNEVERIVTDKTGLDGTFDLELEFAPQGRRPVGLPGPPSPPSDGPPLATALQEQLGLKLESVRGPVPVIIIERAELPTLD